MSHRSIGGPQLPHWLLQMLPMFSYVCPKCNKEVQKYTVKCPHCKATYEQPNKTPPLYMKDPPMMAFLKVVGKNQHLFRKLTSKRLYSLIRDKSKLEKYVHEKILPKVIPAESKELRKYFTPLFSCGHELGNLSLYNSTTGSPTASTNQAHHGSYSMECTASGDYASEIVGDVDTKYVRLYLMTPASITAGEYILFHALYEGDPLYAIIFRLHLKNDAGTWKWGFRYHHDGSLAAEILSTQQTPSPSTWYCVESYFSKGATDAEYEMYVNENELTDISQSGKICDYYGSSVIVGNRFSNSAYTIYIDCVTVADSGPIGEDDAILDDEFNTGRFTEWTTTTSSGCVAEVAQDDPRKGMNYARFYTDSDGASAYAYRNISAMMASYTRIYLKLLNFPTASDHGLPIEILGSGGTISYIQLRTSAGNWFWRLLGRNDASYNTDDGSTYLDTETWYCLELALQIDSTYGWYKLYLDGTEECSLTGKDSDNQGNINSVRVGLVNVTESVDLLIDSVIISEFGPNGQDDYIAVMGFETGDTSEFDDTLVQGSSTLTVAAAHTLFGSYGVEMATSGEGWERSRVEYNDGDTLSISEVYVREYLKFTDISGVNEFQWFHGTDEIMRTYLSSGEWRVTGRNGAAWDFSPLGGTPLEGIWYCLEYGMLIDDSAGWYKLWVDGVQTCSLTGKDTNDYGNVTEIRLGSYANNTTSIIRDYITISTSQIGLGYIFIDDFEATPCDDRWTAQSETGTSTVYCTTDYVYSGSNAIVADVVEAYTYAAERKDFTEQEDFYVRFRIRIPTIALGQVIAPVEIIHISPYLILTRLQVRNNGGTYEWGMRVRDTGLSDPSYSTQQTPSAGEWYDVLINVKTEVGVDDGEVHIFVGNDELTDIEQTGLDMGTDGADRLFVGNVSGNSDTNFKTYFDRVVLHSEYIGVEPSQEAAPPVPGFQKTARLKFILPS